MAKETILAVDDEKDILELLTVNLTREGFRVDTAASGEKALEKADSERPDLILLDLMLPGIDGLEVTRRLKRNDRTRRVPIFMLTAKGGEADVVTGLELGADDYMAKPFSPRILIARIKAVLRRCQRPVMDNNDVIRVNELVIHPGRREVRAGGRPVELTYTEFQVLYHLARRPGWVATRYQIVNAVRGDDYSVTERSVDVQIAGLRKKLGKSGANIETVRGVGYRLKET